MKNKYRRNILMLTLHLVFSKRITGPIMMLFYQAMGLNFGQIGTLSSAVWLSDAALEISGGSFSDTYGRKFASLIYALLGMISMAIYAASSTFPFFLVSSIVYGVALAIGSGSTNALLFDTLKLLGIEKQYKKFRGKIQFPPKLINGLTILILPYLYSQNIRLPFILGFILYFLSFVAAFFIAESPKPKRIDNSMIKAIKATFNDIRNNSKLRLAIAVQIVITGFILLGFEYFQPIIRNAGIPLPYFGAIYASARLIEGAGALLIHKLDRFGNARLIVSIAIAVVASLLGFAICKNFTALIFIAIICLCDGAIDVIISDILNKQASNLNRTTIMSTANLFSSLFFSTLLFAMGFLADEMGIGLMFIYAALIFMLLLGLIWKTTKRGIRA